MDRLAFEREATCRYVPKFDWAREGPPAWAPLESGLAGRRLVFVTSGGFYLRGEQDPFDQDPTHTDPTARVVPWDVDEGRLGISHPFYNHRFALADLGSMVPRTALEEEAAAFGASVCGAFVSFMGYLPHWERIGRELGPAVLDAARALGAGAALLSPG